MPGRGRMGLLEELVKGSSPTHVSPMVTPEASLVAQLVNNPSANVGDPGSIPGWEDPLEKEMTTCSSILAWKIAWTEEPGRLQSMGT